MRASKDYINVKLFEACTRKYQASSEAGGMHSEIKSPGIDNYLLVAIKVIN